MGIEEMDKKKKKGKKRGNREHGWIYVDGLGFIIYCM